MGAFDLTPKIGSVYKSQEFNTSGYFTPSDKLLKNGGIVTVSIVGGGGAGSNGDASSIFGINGLPGHFLKTTTKVIGRVSVVIGSGSTYWNNSGGLSSFNGMAVEGACTTPTHSSANKYYNWGWTAPYFSEIMQNRISHTSSSGLAYQLSLTAVNGKDGTRSEFAAGGLCGVNDDTQVDEEPVATKAGNGSKGSGGGAGAAYWTQTGPTAVAGTGGAGGNGYCLVEWWE